MTAGEIQALNTKTAQDVALIEGVTEQALLRGIVAAAEAFDRAAPLPSLNIRRRNPLWEPAARHYQDLTEAEKAQPRARWNAPKST